MVNEGRGGRAGHAQVTLVVGEEAMCVGESLPPGPPAPHAECGCGCGCGVPRRACPGGSWGGRRGGGLRRLGGVEGGEEGMGDLGDGNPALQLADD